MQIPFTVICSKLRHGESGSIVYHETKDSEGTTIHKPMGMYIAKSNLEFESGIVIYEAVILKKALEDIENDYMHQLNNIHLFDTPECKPTEIQPDDHCLQKHWEI